MLGKCKIVFGHELNHGGIDVRSYGVVNTGACLQIRLLTFIPSCLHSMAYCNCADGNKNL